MIFWTFIIFLAVCLLWIGKSFFWSCFRWIDLQGGTKILLLFAVVALALVLILANQ